MESIEIRASSPKVTGGLWRAGCVERAGTAGLESEIPRAHHNSAHIAAEDGPGHHQFQLADVLEKDGPLDPEFHIGPQGQRRFGQEPDPTPAEVRGDAYPRMQRS